MITHITYGSLEIKNIIKETNDYHFENKKNSCHLSSIHEFFCMSEFIQFLYIISYFYLDM